MANLTNITLPDSSTITISQNDLANATQFLAQYLSSAMPGYDFTPGSALADMVINSIAYVIAYFRYQLTQTQNGLSVATVGAMPAGADQDNAILDLMSNLFVTPTAGDYATGYVTCHFSTLTDVVVPTTAVFNATSTISFGLNSSTDLVVPSSQLNPVVNPLGIVQEYVTTVPLIASQTGAAYNIDPGTFLSYTQFNPYLTKVENTASFQNGIDVESATDMLSKAPNAITLRDLVSNRSIDTTLRSNFSQVQETVIVSYGDPEMQRDLVPDRASVGNIHVGGDVDVYVRGTLATKQSFTGTVGGYFTDPRPNITIFTDTSFFNANGTINGTTFSNLTTGGGIVPEGSVLTITYNGTPYQYLIAQVYPQYLLLYENATFPALATGITYTVGNNPTASPPYSDIINTRTTGEITNEMFINGAVLLPETPIYRVDSVSVLDPTNTFADVNGIVTYPFRINTPPDNSGAVIASSLLYQISCINPDEAPSAEQLMLLYVTLPSQTTQNNNQITIVYDTISNFSNVAEYTTDPFNRNPGASILVKGMHPVYLSFIVGYTLAAVQPVGVATFDPVAAATALVNYIVSFPASEVIHVSNISAFLQSTYPQLISAYPYTIDSLGIAHPYTINYTLYAPNGNTIPYQTSDYVLVDSAHIQIASNTPGYLADPLSLGISGRTVRPLASTLDISFTPV